MALHLYYPSKKTCYMGVVMGFRNITISSKEGLKQLEKILKGKPEKIKRTKQRSRRKDLKKLIEHWLRRDPVDQDHNSDPRQNLS